MISPQVTKKYGHTWRGVMHYPINICLHCGEEDDPETTAHWPEDKDGDKVCLACLPMAVLDRVEAAIARAFKAATTPQDELHYFNALTIVILARKDAEDDETMVKLDAAIDRRKAQSPVTVNRRVA